MVVVMLVGRRGTAPDTPGDLLVIGKEAGGRGRVVGHFRQSVSVLTRNSALHRERNGTCRELVFDKSAGVDIL
jgi:hypothetical protein